MLHHLGGRGGNTEDMYPSPHRRHSPFTLHPAGSINIGAGEEAPPRSTRKGSMPKQRYRNLLPGTTFRSKLSEPNLPDFFRARRHQKWQANPRFRAERHQKRKHIGCGTASVVSRTAAHKQSAKLLRKESPKDAHLPTPPLLLLRVGKPMGNLRGWGIVGHGSKSGVMCRSLALNRPFKSES